MTWRTVAKKLAWAFASGLAAGGTVAFIEAGHSLAAGLALLATIWCVIEGGSA